MLIKKLLNFLKNNFVYGVLIIFLAVGFFFRIYKIGEASYWIDEGFTIMQTKAILAHGYPLLNSGEVELKDPLLPFILAGITKFFGESASVMRFIVALFGTFSIYLSFFLGKKLFNEKVGLIFSFFIAFSYWHIAWGRQIRGYELLLFFTLLFIINLVVHKAKNKNKYLFFALFSIVAAAASKSFGFLLFPFFLIYLFFRKKYIAGLSLLGLFIMLNVFFSHLLINAFNISFVNYFGSYFVGYLWDSFGIIFSMFIVGSFIAFKNDENKNKEIHLLIIAIFLATLIFFSFFVYLNQKRYLFFITPFIFLYASYFLYYIFAISRKMWVFLGMILMVVFVDFFTSQALVIYPKEFYFLEHYTPQPNFNAAYRFIKNEITQDDFVISAYPFMDLIYLNKSDYAIAISYTGREGDTTISKFKEYYSGTKKLYGFGKDLTAIDKLEDLQTKGDVYVILDSMALSRTKPDIRDYVVNSYDHIFQSDDIAEQRVYVYKLAKKD